MKTEAGVTLAPEGVIVHGPRRESQSFEWQSVTRVVSYKIDLLTTDCVCLEFEVGKRSFVVNEEIVGWKQLVARTKEYFAVSEACFDNVIQPPFATNLSLLWDRRVHNALERLSEFQIAELWRLAADDLLPDGSLRDIYIAATSLDDWNRMLAIVRGMFGRVTATSKSAELRHDLAEKHFKGANQAHITFHLGSAKVHGYCFTPSTIELSFSPDTTDRSTWTLILRFVVAAAVVLGLPATVAPENAPDRPILHANADGELRFLPPPAA